jgi:hypothetical protein
LCGIAYLYYSLCDIENQEHLQNFYFLIFIFRGVENYFFACAAGAPFLGHEEGGKE